jgi:hypothetical protein
MSLLLSNKISIKAAGLKSNVFNIPSLSSKKLLSFNAISNSIHLTIEDNQCNIFDDLFQDFKYTIAAWFGPKLGCQVPSYQIYPSQNNYFKFAMILKKMKKTLCSL